MNIDLSRYKVIYADKVMNAIALQDVIYYDKCYPNPAAEHIIFKPEFLCVLVINEDGNVITICDETWRFQFIPIVTKDG